MFLYLTADKIGIPTGGGVVTYNEHEALKSLGQTTSFTCNHYEPRVDPFEQDKDILKRVQHQISSNIYDKHHPKLAHCYSGTLTETVRYLKDIGCKVTYTCAAHDKEISQREHEQLGLPFPYKHLTDPVLWTRYSECYRMADVLICPSQAAKRICQRYGCKNRIEVIPHGCNMSSNVSKLPQDFVVGYLGATGPDKGIRYLLEAWKRLDYKDGSRLLLAGRESTGPMMNYLLEKYDGGNIELVDWVDDVSDFYNRLNLYVQPSATEGFGIEVLEALSYGRFVVCSDGAGAVDIVPKRWQFQSTNISQLMNLIDEVKINRLSPIYWTSPAHIQKIAERYTWDKVRDQYTDLWRSLI